MIKRYGMQQGNPIITRRGTAAQSYGVGHRYHGWLLGFLYVGSIFRFLLRLSGLSYPAAGSFLLSSPNIDATAPATISRSKASLKRHLIINPAPLAVPMNILHVRGRLLLMINSPSVWATAAFNAQHGIFDTIASIVLCIILHGLSLRYSWRRSCSPERSIRKRVKDASRGLKPSPFPQRDTLGGIYENTG